MGTRDGDGAVDGRLRMGRRSFGGLFGSPLLGVWVTPWRVNVSFSGAPLVGAEGVLKARPADCGRRGISSGIFLVPWAVDGRFLLATDPKVGRGSVRLVAVDGRSSCFRLLPLLWLIILVAVDGLLLVTAEEEPPDVEGRTIPPACEDGVVPTTPALVVALRFLCSLVWVASLLTRFRACCSISRHLAANS